MHLLDDQLAILREADEPLSRTLRIILSGAPRAVQAA